MAESAGVTPPASRNPGKSSLSTRGIAPAQPKRFANFRLAGLTPSGAESLCFRGEIEGYIGLVAGLGIKTKSIPGEVWGRTAGLQKEQSVSAARLRDMENFDELSFASSVRRKQSGTPNLRDMGLCRREVARLWRALTA
jgi:hypothetical protein